MYNMQMVVHVSLKQGACPTLCPGPSRSDPLMTANLLVPREPALLGPITELSSQAHILAQKLDHPNVLSPSVRPST